MPRETGPPWNPTLLKAYWTFVGLGCAYAAFIIALAVPVVQKNAIYGHNVRLPIWPDLAQPEQLGFAGNEITPFWLRTEDGEKLFAWHVLPQAVYARHREELMQRDIGVVEDVTTTRGFELLKGDKEARVVIYFHGNAGNVAQGYRPDAYRIWRGVDPEKVHILTFDYRGFGRSSGDPSEKGLITDAITAINFIMHTAGIPPERIVILGHSLGTAVALASTELLAREQNIQFAGVILCSAFSKIKTLILTYSIGGFLPILSPLRPYPIVQKWLTRFVKEPWDGEERLRSLIKHQPGGRITMIHAHNDYEISALNSEILFRTAADAYMHGTVGEGGAEAKERVALSVYEIDKKKVRVELGAEGYIDRWVEGVPEGGWLEHRTVTWGGHAQVVTASALQLVIRQMFGL